MNIVIWDRINELSESKTKFYKLRSMVSNWKAVVMVCVLAITLKSIAEQFALMLIRHQ